MQATASGGTACLMGLRRERVAASLWELSGVGKESGEGVQQEQERFAKGIFGERGAHEGWLVGREL